MSGDQLEKKVRKQGNYTDNIIPDGDFAADGAETLADTLIG